MLVPPTDCAVVLGSGGAAKMDAGEQRGMPAGGGALLDGFAILPFWCKVSALTGSTGPGHSGIRVTGCVRGLMQQM